MVSIEPIRRITVATMGSNTMRMINIEASQNLPWVKGRSLTFQQHPANNPSLAGTLHHG